MPVLHFPRQLKICTGRSLCATVLVATLSLLLSANVVWADDELSSVARLERQLFHHDYPTEGAEARLERLEKMVFGEAKSGSTSARVAALLSAVPLSSSPSADSKAAASPPPVAESGNQTFSGGQALTGQDYQDDRSEPPNSSKYPAVTAIEQKLYGKDFALEPITNRLARLESRLFGKPSNTTDLSDRLDRIKQQTGLDIAKIAPPDSDWADEDDGELFGIPSRRTQGAGDAYRDPKRSLQQAYGIRPSYSHSGQFGLGDDPRTNNAISPPAVASPGRAGSVPPLAPAIGSAQAPPMAPDFRGQAVGLNQQVAALEQEIFGKTFRDPLPSRLERLETTVFPQEKPMLTTSLPARVKRLLDVIPLSRSFGADSRQQIAQTGRRPQADPDFDDFNDPLAPQPAPQRQNGGLGKIINSLSNLLTGGMAGGYMVNGALVTDPQTGLLYDQLSGNLIDPQTGVVVGQKIVPGRSSVGGFNNGFAPYGAAPYGFGSGTSMRFGFGGIGRYGSPGMMWP